MRYIKRSELRKAWRDLVAAGNTVGLVESLLQQGRELLFPDLLAALSED